MATPHPNFRCPSIFILHAFPYSKGIKSHSTAQGVPPVVVSGGLGRLVPRLNPIDSRESATVPRAISVQGLKLGR